MNADRLGHIQSLVAARGKSEHRAQKLCHVAAETTAMSGASILLDSSGAHLTGMCATDSLANGLLDLEILCGEGPACDACRSQSLVQEPDLTSSRELRWLLYAPLARLAGVAAVFSFPLLNENVPFGALSLYHDRPGPLSTAQTADGYCVASLVSDAVMALQPGSSFDTFGESLEREFSLDAATHQATGMVAVQGSMNVTDAFVVLKFHAFATDTSITDLADDVVAGHTYFNSSSFALCVR